MLPDVVEGITSCVMLKAPLLLSLVPAAPAQDILHFLGSLLVSIAFFLLWEKWQQQQPGTRQGQWWPPLALSKSFL